VGDPPADLGGLSADSRRVLSGDLFLAVPGTRVDGHGFLAAAATAGAAAAVVERVIDHPLPQLLVADARAAVAHLGMLFAGDPVEDVRLIGVTGTNGKSTTAWLLRWILASTEPNAAIGTLGIVDAGGELHPGSMTTPDPIELAFALADLRSRGVRTVTLEASSHALDQHRVDGLRFAAIGFTSFSREHLEYHADLESYRAAKLRLIELLEPGGICAVNADEPAWREVGADGTRTIRYGLTPSAQVRATDVELGAGGTCLTLSSFGERARVRLPLPAEFNVMNALAAVAIAVGLETPLAEVGHRLGEVPPVPGRMEVLCEEPTLVIRDYAHTPDAYERVLTMLHGLVDGRVIAVFGCGGERDPGKRPIMGEIATRLADLAVVTTDNPRSEDPAQICRQVVGGLDPASYEIVLDRKDAISFALDAAGSDDAVILLGKGHETYQIIGEERVPFDEAAIVAELAGSVPG